MAYYLRLTAICASRFVAVCVVYLLVWTLAPIALGWTPSVILTGSMQPVISRGDVVLTAPVTAGAPLAAGQVILFDDPADPSRQLMHRIVQAATDGTLITRGDANAEPDSTVVPASAVEGRARLLVPLIGLPALWMRTHRYWPLIGATLTLMIALAGALPRKRPGAGRA